MAMISLNTLHAEMPELAWQIFKVLHIVLMIVALIINCLSLIVVYGLVSKMTRPLQLMSSLAFANMLAPWAVITSYFQHTSCQEEIHMGLLLSAHNAAALTLLIHTLTHHIATFKPLKFDVIVTSIKIWITISFIWILSIVLAHLHFIVASGHRDDLVNTTTLCLQVFNDTYISITVSIVICCITATVGLVSYTRIFIFLRPLGAINRQENGGFPLKSTYGVKTGIILVAFNFLVWLPYLVSAYQHVKVHNTKEGQATVIVMFTTMVLILINCACNPVIYGLRMDNVTMGYAQLYEKCRSGLSRGWTRIRNNNENDEHPTSPLRPIESIC